MQSSFPSRPSADGAFDVAVVGGGPSGSTCAAFCAAGGLRTLLLERETFPREKVCGDCLNPAAWPVLERLGVAEAVCALPSSRLREVEFADSRGRSLCVPLPPGPRGETGIRRSLLDALLLDAARSHGVEVRERATVEQITRDRNGWRVEAGGRAYSASVLVAADGRNSTVARLLGLLPRASRDRIALQAHFAAEQEHEGRVVMRFLPWGYSGLAPVGEGLLNLCLVARPRDIDALKAWALGHFSLGPDQTWRTVTPLTRSPLRPAGDGLLLVGDAARVVEPFTGEGIFYALATGELAARHLIRGDLRGYARAQARLYRGRMWVNHLARAACLHPRFASALLLAGRRWPGLLANLTAKVARPPATPASAAR
jgi:geranylgeranyl reductase family protein